MVAEASLITRRMRVLPVLAVVGKVKVPLSVAALALLPLTTNSPASVNTPFWL